MEGCWQSGRNDTPFDHAHDKAPAWDSHLSAAPAPRPKLCSIPIITPMYDFVNKAGLEGYIPELSVTLRQAALAGAF
jgi:hypothetical protein